MNTKLNSKINRFSEFSQTYSVSLNFMSQDVRGQDLQNKANKFKASSDKLLKDAKKAEKQLEGFLSHLMQLQQTVK